MQALARIVFLLAAAILAAPASAKNNLTPAELRATDLRGLWMSEAGDARSRVVLSVTNVVNSQGDDVKLAAQWGTVLVPWRDAKEASARVSGDRLEVALVTAFSTKVSLALESEGVLAGTLTLANGRSYPVRLRRTALADIHAWIAANPLPEARARRDSVIELAYVSATDCTYCHGWEVEYLSGGAPKPALGWEGVKLTTIQINSFRAAARPDTFPPHLREAVTQVLKDKGWRYFQGTPQFLVVVNGVVRVHVFGTRDFPTLVQAALKAAIEEKRAAG